MDHPTEKGSFLTKAGESEDHMTRLMAALLIVMIKVRMKTKGGIPAWFLLQYTPFIVTKLGKNTSGKCIPAGNLEATLLKGIFMISLMLPEKALQIFGMLYTEFMRGTASSRKELKYAK